MHNSKKIVNLQGLFVLTVVYVDMTTHPVRKYCHVIKRASFIDKFFYIFYYSSVHFSSCCFCMQYHGAIREITSMPV